MRSWHIRLPCRIQWRSCTLNWADVGLTALHARIYQEKKIVVSSACPNKKAAEQNAARAMVVPWQRERRSADNLEKWMVINGGFTTMTITASIVTLWGRFLIWPMFWCVGTINKRICFLWQIWAVIPGTTPKGFCGLEDASCMWANDLSVLLQGSREKKIIVCVQPCIPWSLMLRNWKVTILKESNLPTI